MTQTSRQGGFTLIELIVVMVVFSLLWLSLGYGMKTGLQIWDRQARAVALRDDLDTTDRTLRQLIGAMVPPGGPGGATIKGAADDLSFTTRLPSAVALSTRLATVELALHAHRLVMIWSPHPHEVSLVGDQPSSTAALLGNVEKVEFAYWHPAAADSKGGWQETWTDQQKPDLIRIHIEFANGDPRHWPDIVAGPMSDSSQ